MTHVTFTLAASVRSSLTCSICTPDTDQDFRTGKAFGSLHSGIITVVRV